MTSPHPEMSDEELQALANPDLSGLQDILPPLAPPQTLALSTWSQLPTPPSRKQTQREQRAAETQAVAMIRPEHRVIASYRAQGMTPKQIGVLMERTGQSVSDVLKRPDVKLALAYYNRTLAEKAMQSRHLAANMLPRALMKTGEMLEKPDVQERHLINATNMLAGIAGAKQEQPADPAANTIVINLTPDAARQMTAPSSPGRAQDVEWEEIVVEPEGKDEIP